MKIATPKKSIENHHNLNQTNNDQFDQILVSDDHKENSWITEGKNSVKNEQIFNNNLKMGNSVRSIFGIGESKQKTITNKADQHMKERILSMTTASKNKGGRPANKNKKKIQALGQVRKYNPKNQNK